MHQTIATAEHPGTDNGRNFVMSTGTRVPAPTGGPVLNIDLPAAFRQLQHESRWSGNRNAMTLVKHPDLRVVLAAVQAGSRLQQHHVRGTVLIQVLSGQVQVEILGSTVDVTAGQIISLDPNLPHQVLAIDNSALLIAIAWSEQQHLPPATISQPEPETDPDQAWDWRADEAVWN